MNSIVALPIAAATVVAAPLLDHANPDGELMCLIDQLSARSKRYEKIMEHTNTKEKAYLTEKNEKTEAAFDEAQAIDNGAWGDLKVLERKVFATEARTLAGIKAKARWHVQYYCQGDLGQLDGDDENVVALFWELSQDDLSAPTPAKAAHVQQLTTTDPIFALIEAHKAADEDLRAAVHHEFEMEEQIPSEKRRSVFRVWETAVVVTDDPRWPAACIRRNETYDRLEEIAFRMINEPPVSIEGLTALLAYAVEYVESGNPWPDNIEDENEAVQRFANQAPWQHYVIANAAEFLRGLNAPTPAGATTRGKIAA